MQALGANEIMGSIKIEMESNALVIIFGVPFMIMAIILLSIIITRQEFPPVKIENKIIIPENIINMKMEKPEVTVTVTEIINEKAVVCPVEIKNQINIPEIKIPEIRIPEIKIPAAPKAEVTFINKSEQIDNQEGKLLPPPKER